MLRREVAIFPASFEPVPQALAVKVRFDDHTMIVELTDGRTISVPLAWFPRQFDATPEQRTGYELIGRGQGIHWKRSTKIYLVAGLLRGNHSGARKTLLIK